MRKVKEDKRKINSVRCLLSNGVNKRYGLTDEEIAIGEDGK